METDDLVKQMESLEDELHKVKEERDRLAKELKQAQDWVNTITEQRNKFAKELEEAQERWETWKKTANAETTALVDMRLERDSLNAANVAKMQDINDLKQKHNQFREVNNRLEVELAKVQEERDLARAEVRSLQDNKGFCRCPADCHDAPGGHNDWCPASDRYIPLETWKRRAEAAEKEVETLKRFLVDADNRASELQEALEHPNRELLGMVVRKAWMEWAVEQPNPKKSWLVPWDLMGENDREVDRRIGEAVARAALEKVRE